MPDSSPIILIAGPPGAGKTTTARALVAASTEPIAYVEGDAFWHFIAKPKPAETPMEGFMQNARLIVQAMVASALRFARGGYATVLDFTLRPQTVEGIVAKIHETPFDYVILCPSEAVCAERAAKRCEGTMPDYAPYHELYMSFTELGPLERHALRSEDASPAELAAQIRAGLATGAYRFQSKT